MMWLGILICGVGLGVLMTLASDYDKRSGRGLRRLIGLWVCWPAVALSAGGAIFFSSVAPRDGCGSRTGWQSDLSVALMLAFIVLGVLGFICIYERTGWLLLVLLGCGDVGVMVMLEADRQQHDRMAIIVLFLVHAASSFIAADWARRLRAASDVRYVKATEPGRFLGGGWLAVALLGLASLHSQDLHLIPDTSLFGLIVVGAATGILGSGYTKYVEARDATEVPSTQEGAVAAKAQLASAAPDSTTPVIPHGSMPAFGLLLVSGLIALARRHRFRAGS